jgi:predicted glycoside hydrolase/deacetylase ChbG (UPF0249 family)
MTILLTIFLFSVQIRKETVAQIERFIAFTGYAPPYVDGHQHVHVLPGTHHTLHSSRLHYALC